MTENNHRKEVDKSNNNINQSITGHLVLTKLHNTTSNFCTQETCLCYNKGFLEGVDWQKNQKKEKEGIT